MYPVGQVLDVLKPCICTLPSLVAFCGELFIDSFHSTLPSDDLPLLEM